MSLPLRNHLIERLGVLSLTISNFSLNQLNLQTKLKVVSLVHSWRLTFKSKFSYLTIKNLFGFLIPKKGSLLCQRTLVNWEYRGLPIGLSTFADNLSRNKKSPDFNKLTKSYLNILKINPVLIQYCSYKKFTKYSKVKVYGNVPFKVNYFSLMNHPNHVVVQLHI